MTGAFTVPLSAIAQVAASDDPLSLVHGVKVGVGLPKTKIGTWHYDEGEDYVCIRDARPAVVLTLAPGQRFAKVVVSVHNPTELAAKIQAAVAEAPETAHVDESAVDQ